MANREIKMSRKSKIIITIIVILGVAIAGLLVEHYLTLARFYHSVNLMKECSGNMKEIYFALKEYADKNNGELPDVHKWNDVLLDAGFDIDKFVCVLEQQDENCLKCSYAINKNVVNMTLSEIPRDMVLLFECDSGWNQVLGSEDAKAHNITGTEYGRVNVLLGRGGVMQVPIQDINMYQWTK